jgi:prevent-host-death family protein
MANDVISISDAKRNLNNLVREVEGGGKAYFIARNSRGSAALVGLKEYQELLDRLEELEDVCDMLIAQQEPARPFEDYLKEREGKK